MKSIRYIIIILWLLTLGACAQAPENKLSKDKKAYPPQVVKKIDDFELAKLILRPKREKIDISKDPFAPLLKKTDVMLQKTEEGTVSDIEGLSFVGVVRVENEYIVLLKTKTKKGFFKIDDQINDYIIKDIQRDQIVLSNGKDTITLKRGAEK